MEKPAAQRPMIRLFGRLEAWSRGGRPIAFSSEKSKQLLAMLALEKGAPVSRSILVTRLWPDGAEERLRRSLSTETWRLRCALSNVGEDASRWIIARPESLAFAGDEEILIDTDAFDRCLSALHADSENPSAGLDAIEQLYRGDLLAEIADDWCLVQREAYRGRFVSCLEMLLTAAKRRLDWQEAVRVARRMLAEDCFLEHIHREVMNCYAMMGNRAAALRHYEKLQLVLRQELGISPTRDTAALYNLLRGDEQQPEAPMASSAAAQDLERRLDLIQQRLHQLTQELSDFKLLVRADSRSAA